jgi:GT2 family glycosyltransferase
MGEVRHIGVVTVTFNSASVISGFMDSILKQTHSQFTLYIVDNASSDRTLQLISQYSEPRVVLVRNLNNVGVGEGNNIGIKSALRDGCATVLLINNDTEFAPDLLSGLDDALKRHESDMVVPKIVYFDEPHKIWSAGGYFHPILGWTRHFGEGSEDDTEFDSPRRVNYSPTCCMLIKRDVFERIGFMDTNYFVYFDDTDFCYRAYRAGIKLFYVPAVRLLHKVASLTGIESDFAVRYGIRNRVYYVLKNLPMWHALLILLALQIHIPLKCVLLRLRLRQLWVAEKAFFDGISVYRASRRQVDVLARLAAPTDDPRAAR